MPSKHSSTRSTLWEETLSSFSSSMATSRKLCHELTVRFAIKQQLSSTFLCWLTFDFSSFSRGKTWLNKNLRLFRSSLAKSSLMLAINTLKWNNKTKSWKDSTVKDDEGFTTGLTGNSAQNAWTTKSSPPHLWWFYTPSSKCRNVSVVPSVPSATADRCRGAALYVPGVPSRTQCWVPSQNCHTDTGASIVRCRWVPQRPGWSPVADPCPWKRLIRSWFVWQLSDATKRWSATIGIPWTTPPPQIWT